MNDEIIKGYPLSGFLQSEKFRSRSPETRRNYTNYLRALQRYMAPYGEPTGPLMAEWIDCLQQSYGRKSVNVHITAANQYFRWCGRLDLLRGHLKADTDADPPTPAVTRVEYLRLLRAARVLGKQRSYLLIKLFTTTDLPLQCLGQVTAEMVERGYGTLHCNAERISFRCPAPLRLELLDYMAQTGVTRGPVFITRGNRPISRGTVFNCMRELCRVAGVPEEKGNPRSFRNLYKATQRQLDDRVAVLKDQMYDQMIEMEQAAIAWPREPDASPGRTA